MIAVVQPHRYTRLSSLFDDFATCFNDADTVIVADVYPAGEAPIEGVDKTALATAIGAMATGMRCPVDAGETRGAGPHAGEAGRLCRLLGAGTITQWAYSLPGELAALDKASIA